jgi:hypothetical protein
VSVAAVTSDSCAWPYRITLSLAVLVALLALVFFVIGLVDGSVTASNIVLWLGLMMAAALIPFAGIRLRSRGRTGAALAMLSLLALPGLLYALFIALVVLSGEHWN